MLPDIDELAELVKAAAREEILPRLGRADSRRKPDGGLVTEADFRMQARLEQALARRYPEYELLGEEMDEARQAELLGRGEGGVWCLDPLDGTNNFVAGLPFFCVSLALLSGGESALGIVYDPIRDECFAAERGRGARLNGARLECPAPALPLRRCLAVVDFKRLAPELAARLATRPPYSSHRYLGAGALEWCWLAAGRFHAYLHGGQKLWDYAAGALILAEAGGCSQTLGGGAVAAAGLRAVPVVAAADTRLLAEWRAALEGLWA
jgi:myo-inositol-1(or 4)-monophosphatase